MAIKNILTLELTTTALCDLNCTYCFEGNKSNSKKFEHLDLLIKRIYEILSDEWFINNYEVLNISFWGGEPTLNPNYIIKIINEFKNIDTVDFHIYSNGFNLKNIKHIVQSIETKKLRIQISYDGKIVNDLYRLTNNGEISSNSVLETFDFLVKSNVNVSLKSTLPFEMISNLYEIWLDFEQMFDKYKTYKNANITFSPTIDYTQRKNESITNDSLDIFRQQILKIAKKEIDFYQVNKRFLMSWFNSSDKKINCTAGKNIIIVDVDGSTYVCHGALYVEDKEKLKSSTIYDNEFINNIKKFSNVFEQSINNIPKECNICVATYCAVCPVNTFQISMKETMIEKWEDRTINLLCDYYKIFGEIDRSVQNFIYRRK